MDEISLQGMFSLELVKKERFCGSHGKMRYMLCKSEDRLQAFVYPEPFCWEATPDDQKQSEYFELSNEGIAQAVAWINRKYSETTEKN
ncbi:MAG: hypothetical protein ACLVEV_05710 [Lachnospiraceae bacterium]|uniref:hypothetical protein n=1 Tax=Parablautia sp. Marseille-Q6255 TaxID=3039593 RepID=UPI0024BC00D4|nr:hypothetical protein [Parablautia sp. Marseille-Q6255]